MGLLKQIDVAPEEEKERQRDNSIANSIIGNDAPDIPGITCLRGMSPLVMTALHRSDNPYVVGKPGFEAAGIKFEPDGSVKDFAAFGVAMMPKTAAVLVLWTCSREELKRFAMAPEALESASLDYMEEFAGGVAGLAKVTIHVSEALQAVQLSKAVAVDKDEAPKASTLNGEGHTGPKKLARTGSHKS